MGTENAHVGGGLYFTLTIANRAPHPIELPAHISPEHGSLRVTTIHENGTNSLHHGHHVVCSDARLSLMPGQSIIRSFALIGRPEQPLFAAPGRYRCDIQTDRQSRRDPGDAGQHRL